MARRERSSNRNWERIGPLAAGAMLLACLLPTAGWANAISVPGEMCRNYFMVPITLAARAAYPADEDARTLWFIYDTGASVTTVDPDSLERVTNRTIDAGGRVNFRDVTAGRVSWGRLPSRVQDLDHLSKAFGREIDGILAYTAFDEFLVTLDYAVGEIRLETGSLPRPDGETVFDVDGKDVRPWLNVRFADETRRLLVDSGAGLSVLSLRDPGEPPTVAEPVTSGAAMRMTRVERQTSARLADDVFLGPNRLVQPVVSRTVQSEKIGGQVMQHFTWTFDIRKERVRIVPREDSMPTFGPERGHGLVLAPDARGLRVHQIIEGAEAAHSGIAVGDVVYQVNGQPMLERGCAVEVPDPTTVTVWRGDESLEFTFPLTTFVP